MKQLHFVLILFLISASLKAQFTNKDLLAPSVQDSTFTLIGFDADFTDLDIIQMHGEWAVGDLKKGKDANEGYLVLPVQSKTEQGTTVLGCALMHSSDVDISALTMGSPGFYRMRSLDKALAATFMSKSMIGQLTKKDCFSALMYQIRIQDLLNKGGNQNQLAWLFKETEGKTFLFDANLLSNDQITPENTVLGLSAISTEVNISSKDVKDQDLTNFVVYLVDLPVSMGGAHMICVYDRTSGMFFSEKLKGFKGVSGNLSNKELENFQFAVQNSTETRWLLGK